MKFSNEASYISMMIGLLQENYCSPHLISLRIMCVIKFLGHDFLCSEPFESNDNDTLGNTHISSSIFFNPRDLPDCPVLLSSCPPFPRWTRAGGSVKLTAGLGCSPPTTWRSGNDGRGAGAGAGAGSGARTIDMTSDHTLRWALLSKWCGELRLELFRVAQCPVACLCFVTFWACLLKYWLHNLGAYFFHHCSSDSLFFYLFLNLYFTPG